MMQKIDIENYFNAEKQAGLVFIIVGIISIIAAIVFYFFLKTILLKGASVPLIIIGLLMMIVGFTIHNRSDADRTKNVYALDMNPQQLKESEIPRMNKVMKSFTIIKYTEYVLAFAGIFLFFFLRKNESMLFWRGFGLSLYIMTFIAIVADYYGEKRAGEYLQKLENHFKNEL